MQFLQVIDHSEEGFLMTVFESPMLLQATPKTVWFTKLVLGGIISLVYYRRYIWRGDICSHLPSMPQGVGKDGTLLEKLHEN